MALLTLVVPLLKKFNPILEWRCFTIILRLPIFQWFITNIYLRLRVTAINELHVPDIWPKQTYPPEEKCMTFLANFIISQILMRTMVLLLFVSFLFFYKYTYAYYIKWNLIKKLSFGWLYTQSYVHKWHIFVPAFIFPFFLRWINAFHLHR